MDAVKITPAMRRHCEHLARGKGYCSWFKTVDATTFVLSMGSGIHSSPNTLIVKRMEEAGLLRWKPASHPAVRTIKGHVAELTKLGKAVALKEAVSNGWPIPSTKKKVTIKEVGLK